jgi:hypothetical protein
MIGGFSNAVSASAVRGVVVGGGFNTNAGRSAVILGGEFNAIGVNSTGAAIVGGFDNIIQSNSRSATIGGGENNSVDVNSVFATIGGGQSNVITTNSTNAVISGGFGNVVSNSFATVGGGERNTASGNAATVGGGQNNTVSGNYSTVPGGIRSKATHSGAFVWSGVFTVDTVSTNDNSFTVRAPGGARFLSTTNTNAFVGVILTNAATAWASLSDSNSKTDFEKIKPREILSKVAAMPVTSWHYKHDLKRRYIGPMAQDFHNAFGLGSDDKTISTLDSDGVMYAAIQGLVEELNDRDEEIEKLKMQNAEVLTELRAIRQQLSDLPPAP